MAIRGPENKFQDGEIIIVLETSTPFTSTTKRRGAKRVQCWMPPWGEMGDGSWPVILTRSCRSTKKAPTQRTMASWTPRTSNSCSKALWSTRSNPLLKSIKRILAYTPSLSSDSRKTCMKYTSVWVVDLRATANCLLSSWYWTWESKLGRVGISLYMEIIYGRV